MKLHDLKSPEGSTHRKRIVGRGIAGKGGKTAGRGTKGQKARRQIPAQFEGGQNPLIQRIPKLKGFTNPFRVEYTPVNLDALAALGVSDVTFNVLVERGLARRKDLVKVLGRGELSAKLGPLGHRIRGRYGHGAQEALRRPSSCIGQPAPEPLDQNRV
jgi:large subunit ribosomal protein L15